jgi:hypothetical protein
MNPLTPQETLQLAPKTPFARAEQAQGEQVRPEGTPILKNKVEKSGKFSTTK